MEEQKNRLFRQKNLESIESPEVLDHYLRVTSPGVWLVMAAVILILIGVCVWGVFGHIDSTVDVAVISEDGASYCLVPQDALQAVIEDREITVNGETLELAPKTIEPQTIDSKTNVYVLLAGNLKSGDIVYPVDISSSLEEGIYTGTITTETISPMKFLFN